MIYVLYFIIYIIFIIPGIPKHNFIYNDREIQTGSRKGEMRKTVTLFIPPYLFKRKKKALNIGKKATFECISCAKNDVKTYANTLRKKEVCARWPDPP